MLQPSIKATLFHVSFLESIALSMFNSFLESLPSGTFVVASTTLPIIDQTGLSNLNPLSFNKSLLNFSVWIDWYILRSLDPIGGEKLRACNKV